MRNFIYPVLTVLWTILIVSCYRIDNSGPENPWESTDISTQTPIRKIYASPLELLVVTDDEFYKLDLDNEIVEKRLIGLRSNFFGRPAISDFTFVRMVRTTTEDRIAEFHVVRNADQVYELPVRNYEDGSGERFEFEGEIRNPGAYNIDGSQFLLPLRVLRETERFFTFLLLDIRLNASRTEIETVELNQRIDIPDLPGDQGTLSNIKFINGNYYVTSKEGAYRISPDGLVLPLLNSWRFDTFFSDGNLYMTSFDDFQYYKSEDNGVNWSIVGEATPLKMVESANNQLFTQIHLGAPFLLVNDDLISANDIVLNEDFPEGGDAYYSNIVYFYGNYYLSNQKEIYYLDEIQTK